MVIGVGRKWGSLPTSIAIIQLISKDLADAISELLEAEKKCFWKTG